MHLFGVNPTDVFREAGEKKSYLIIITYKYIHIHIHILDTHDDDVHKTHHNGVCGQEECVFLLKAYIYSYRTAILYNFTQSGVRRVFPLTSARAHTFTNR